MTYRFNILITLFVFSTSSIWAQQERWQQRVEYKMDIEVDEEKHQFTGKQNLVYYNNSNEDLTKVFYHLYFNAFQPNSMMDVRSRTIQDADPRVGDRILGLKEDEIGYHKINSLKHNGKDVKFEVVGTILEVTLDEPIKAGTTATFDMEFNSQVPVQIRRSGWNNKEGVEFSMSQWYPKLCEYDYQGWHSNPYVGREFHGVWGDFEVNITIDKKYILGGTGVLQNPNEIGYGYEDEGKKVKQKKNKENLTWKFKAENVHDFVWAADPDYIHDIKVVNDSFVLHFLYQDDENYNEVWKKAEESTVKAFQFIQTRYGTYPYAQYSIIQAGDGGMEYPMATLITGKRKYRSLIGVIVHEAMHTWYQMLMGSNESLYPWMDEGFTSYASSVVTGHLFNRHDVFLHEGSYRGYEYLAKSGAEEPMSTHADHYFTNFAYGQASYSKGAVFLSQINYIVGKEVFDRGMLQYYDDWHFKHPNPNDFIRVMEKESGLELDWYKEYFVNSTHHINYSIVDVVKKDTLSKDSIVIRAKEGSYMLQGGAIDAAQTSVFLEKKGGMPMPLDIVVTYEQDGMTKFETFYIPIQLMRGNKADEKLNGKQTIMPDWQWTHDVYQLNLPIPTESIQKIEIDPSLRLADIDREDNVWPLENN